jgi:serine/threonine protein phosphatase PrpC
MHISEASTVEILEPDLKDFAARYFGPPTPLVRVEFGALSHVGKVRPTNEDHFAVVRRRRAREVLLTNLPEGVVPCEAHDDAYVMVVADGIGGAAFGELASMTALRIGWELGTSAFKWHFKLTEAEQAELMENLRIYGEVIHRRLRDEAVANPRLEGMGTTITCVLTAGLDGVIAHVGDSRAYVFRGGRLRQLTRDHTLAQELVDAGELASLAEASRFMRVALTNCLGGKFPTVKVETTPLHLADGDRLLLCTDGLSDLVSEEEIIKVLHEQPASQDACRLLVEQALDRGGRDNVTVILARYERVAS